MPRGGGGGRKGCSRGWKRSGRLCIGRLLLCIQYIYTYEYIPSKTSVMKALSRAYNRDVEGRVKGWYEDEKRLLKKRRNLLR